MKRHFFIVVPSFIPTGPVRGAIALANGLVQSRSVTLVGLRGGDASLLGVDPGIEVLDFQDYRKMRAWRAALVQRLVERGGKVGTALVSFCFSADMLSVTLRRYTRVLISIRGNLPMNYQHDYGCLGLPLAYFHLVVAARADRLIAMSQAMADQIRSITWRNSIIVPNFIDEDRCAAFAVSAPAVGDPVLIFVGSMSSRKKPHLLIYAFEDLLREKPEARLHYVGDGPLFDSIRDALKTRKLDDAVTLHGQVSNPLSIVNRGHILVAPSVSEGISRAVLEALFLGLPCVVRRSDGNSDLIKDGQNGFLFDEDADLGEAICKALCLVADRKIRENLLPAEFRQAVCVQSILIAAENL